MNGFEATKENIINKISTELARDEIANTLDPNYKKYLEFLIQTAKSIGQGDYSKFAETYQAIEQKKAKKARGEITDSEHIKKMKKDYVEALNNQDIENSYSLLHRAFQQSAVGEITDKEYRVMEDRFVELLNSIEGRATGNVDFGNIRTDITESKFDYPSEIHQDIPLAA